MVHRFRVSCFVLRVSGFRISGLRVWSTGFGFECTDLAAAYADVSRGHVRVRPDVPEQLCASRLSFHVLRSTGVSCLEVGICDLGLGLGCGGLESEVWVLRFGS